MAGKPSVLEVTEVVKDYRGLRPLRIHDLTIASGDQVALLGFDQPSAEVFVNLITGATLPDAGRVVVFGRSTESIADGAAWLAVVDRFGIVSERAVLLDHLTVIQNLCMPFTLDVEPPHDEVRTRAERLAAEVGLDELLWTKAAGAIDGTSRLRVRLGRALALDPQLLLLEHASAALDTAAVPGAGVGIRAVAAQRGVALVALTADDAFARAVAARVLTLNPANGRFTDAGRRGWFRRLG